MFSTTVSLHSVSSIAGLLWNPGDTHVSKSGLFLLFRRLAVISLPLPVNHFSLLEGKCRGTGIMNVVSRRSAIEWRIERGAGPSPVSGLVKAGVSRNVGGFLARVNEVFIVSAFERAVGNSPYRNDLLFRVADKGVEYLFIGRCRVGGAGR